MPSKIFGFTRGLQSGDAAPVAFTIIQPDSGTSPTATAINSTLTLHSNTNLFTITGNSATKTITFDLPSTYATTGGSDPNFTLTPSPAITSYVAGQEFTFKASFSPTSNPTLNVNGLGAKSLRYSDGNLMGNGNNSIAMKSGQIYTAVYDGTNFIVTNLPVNYSDNITGISWPNFVTRTASGDSVFNTVTAGGVVTGTVAGANGYSRMDVNGYRWIDGNLQASGNFNTRELYGEFGEDGGAVMQWDANGNNDFLINTYNTGQIIFTSSGGSVLTLDAGGNFSLLGSATTTGISTSGGDVAVNAGQHITLTAGTSGNFNVYDGNSNLRFQVSSNDEFFLRDGSGITGIDSNTGVLTLSANNSIVLNKTTEIDADLTVNGPSYLDGGYISTDNNGTLTLATGGVNPVVFSTNSGGGTPSANFNIGTNHNLSFQPNIGLSSGIAFASVNDGSTANLPIEFRATQFLFNEIGGGTNGTEFTSNFVKIPVLNLASPQTTVNGSVSGTVVFSQPLQGVPSKECIAYLSSLNGTASYTFPKPFAHTPVVVSTNGLATTVVTALSTTAMTVTGANSTGPIFVKGP